MSDFIVRQTTFAGERPNYLVLIADDVRRDDECGERTYLYCGHAFKFESVSRCTWVSNQRKATRFDRRLKKAALTFARANVSSQEQNDPERPINFVRLIPKESAA